MLCSTEVILDKLACVLASRPISKNGLETHVILLANPEM